MRVFQAQGEGEGRACVVLSTNSSLFLDWAEVQPITNAPVGFEYSTYLQGGFVVLSKQRLWDEKQNTQPEIVTRPVKSKGIYEGTQKKKQWMKKKTKGSSAQEKWGGPTRKMQILRGNEYMYADTEY